MIVFLTYKETNSIMAQTRGHFKKLGLKHTFSHYKEQNDEYETSLSQQELFLLGIKYGVNFIINNKDENNTSSCGTCD